MKNVTNSYGYYLSEDSDTIELQGNFDINVIEKTTKNPNEQLNYKVFVSPKKNINFAIQIVGGDFPQNIYIPQHIYKDLQIAYSENNPYYTVDNISVIKLDFTNTGNSIIKYLKNKFETPVGSSALSKLADAGATKVVNYAGFKESEQPDDEAILKQILFLFDEQNEIIFVEKNAELVTEDIIKERKYTSQRIRGTYVYETEYFDSSGKFKEGLLNSTSNISLESSTFGAVNQLSDFIKDFSGKSLQEVNSVYSANKSENIQAPANTNLLQSVGRIMGGLRIDNNFIAGVGAGAGLATGIAGGIKAGMDKIAQLKAQKALKQAEEFKNMAKIAGVNAQAQAEAGVAALTAGIQGGISNATDMATGAVSNVISIFKKPVIPKFSIKNPNKVFIKPKVNKFKIQAIGETLDSATSVVDSAQNAVNQAQNAVNQAQNAVQSAASNAMGVVNQAQSAAQSAAFTISSAANKAQSIAAAASSTAANIAGAANSAIGKINSISTISTIGNVGLTEGLNMIKNAATQTVDTLKSANADFLKGN